MQKLEIIGRLGADAKVVSTQNGDFVSFNVAVSDKKKVNGETDAVWYSVSYNNTKIAQYLTKGTMVYCEGKPSYDLKDGKVYPRLSAFAVEFCGGSSNANSAQPSPQQNAQPSPQPSVQKENDDDLPF